MQTLLDAKQRIMRGESLSSPAGHGHGDDATHNHYYVADGKHAASNVAVVADAYALAYAEPDDAKHHGDSKYGGGNDYNDDYRY